MFNSCCIFYLVPVNMALNTSCGCFKSRLKVYNFICRYAYICICSILQARSHTSYIPSLPTTTSVPGGITLQSSVYRAATALASCALNAVINFSLAAAISSLNATKDKKKQTTT